MAYVPSIDVDKYEEQLGAKVSRVRELFSDFKLPEIEVFRSPPEHYRCRCEFSLWHEGDDMYYVMYEAVEGQEKPQRKRIDQFPVASKAINEMMPVVLSEAANDDVLRRKLFQVNFHGTVSGQNTVTLVYHKSLEQVAEQWKERAGKLRARLAECPSVTEVHVVGRSKSQKIVLDQDYVVERMDIHGREFSQKQPTGSFSQPNGIMCRHMVSWAQEVSRDSPGDLLELYCGNGNFTIPLAQNFRRVVATELAKASTAAARDNLVANAVDNVFLARMSSEEFVEAWKAKAAKVRLTGLDWDTLDVRTLLVDPPRSGLDAETEKLMATFERVIYISCNPDTLHANLQRVKGTHRVARFALFDQFPFTHHVECGAFLIRNADVASAAFV